MAVSGTTTFNPPIGTLTLNAFARCGVRRTELTQQHMDDAYLECNLLQSDWSTEMTFFTVEKIDQALTQGTATYDVPARAVSVLDLYITIGEGDEATNRLILPFSRTDYASLAEPSTQGVPTSFWWDRALSPTITLWPVPDGENVYTMSYYIYSQMQDANIRQGGNAAIPYWWMNAYVADLAHRLSRIYAPEREQIRKMDKDEAYARASRQVENAPMYIQPGLEGYFRS